MASFTLYPPIVDSYMPAFTGGKCRVYFSLSKYNAIKDIENGGIHVVVSKQATGMNVVNKNNVESSTGIIVNKVPIKVEDKDNLYYITINNNEIKEGWQAGWIYKIQIRLSSVKYNSTDSLSVWLNINASNFSEWSTVCTTKAIGDIRVLIPTINYDSAKQQTVNTTETVENLYLSTLDLYGHIESSDKSEKLYKYSFQLYNKDRTQLLEDSGELYSNKYQDINEFKYTMKTELEDKTSYSLTFFYETNNKYTESHIIDFIANLSLIGDINCNIYTIDNDPYNIFKRATSVHEEEEEGRIGLKLYSADSQAYSGNICVRRCSSKDNFSYWTDIKIIVCKQTVINNLPIFYDYTIESGVFYKYGVQSIKVDGTRSNLNKMTTPAMRDFEYSFLLGENNQQLKLKFNNTMGSYKIQMMESKNEPIGGEHPIITRNAALRYRIFPINGTISFWMDDNHLFCDKEVIYGSKAIADLYKKYSYDLVTTPELDKEYTYNLAGETTPEFENQKKSEPSVGSNKQLAQEMYDYIYERDFRKMVLNFLHDGKPKLFKSPTEGNIIVRLTDISCTPNQTLDRMIYDFTSTANELAEDNMENYLKYKFYTLDECEDDFSIGSVKLGQVQGTFAYNTNIIKEIFNKYDSNGRNLAGYSKKILEIYALKITFEDPPLRIENNGMITLGNNIQTSVATVENSDRNIITVSGNTREYVFDKNIKFDESSSLYLLGDAEGRIKSVNASIDFLYNLSSSPYEDKQIKTQKTGSGIGQVFETYKPGQSIYKDIYYKYYLDTDRNFNLLQGIDALEIETDPFVKIKIKDSADATAESHIVNQTGTLRINDLGSITQIIYEGIVDPKTGDTNKDTPVDILINYHYSSIFGDYKI